MPTNWKNLEKKLFSQRRVGYWFILPTLSFLLIFVVIPLLFTIYLSFTTYNILSPARWAGLANFSRLFVKNSLFLTALKNTFIYVAGVIPPTMIISLAFALLLNKVVKFVTVFRAIYYTPVITSMVAVSVMWLWVFNPDIGILNRVLQQTFGLPGLNWLRDPNLAMFCVITVAVWKNVGYFMLIFLAGLQGIPNYLYEVARIDGANRWHMFYKITLPLLRPVIFFVFVILCIGSFQVFDQVYIMTKGGPAGATSVVVYRIYQEGFTFLRMGYASSLAMILFFIMIVFTYLNVRLLRGEVEYW